MQLLSKKLVEETEAALLTAMKKSDIRSLDELLDDDLLFTIPTGQTITKVMDIDNWRTGRIVMHEIVPSEQVISIIGDNAIVSVLLELSGTFSGQFIGGKFRYTRIWKLTNGKMRVIGGSGIQLT